MDAHPKDGRQEVVLLITGLLVIFGFYMAGGLALVTGSGGLCLAVGVGQLAVARFAPSSSGPYRALRWITVVFGVAMVVLGVNALIWPPIG
jgi:hypothetical protein